jgi:hypothetical protein
VKRRAFQTSLGSWLRVDPGRGQAFLVSHAENDTQSAVPRHAEISNELIKKICKDLGIEPPATR